jgi:hypothetical protein
MPEAGTSGSMSGEGKRSNFGHSVLPRLYASIAVSIPTNFLRPLLTEENPPNGPLIAPNFLIREHASTNWSEKSIFPRCWAILTPRRSDAIFLESLRTPGQHRPLMVRQRKGRAHMHRTPPCLERRTGHQLIFQGNRQENSLPIIVRLEFGHVLSLHKVVTYIWSKTSTKSLKIPVTNRC